VPGPVVDDGARQRVGHPSPHRLEALHGRGVGIDLRGQGRDGFALYYPLLVTHIVFGSVALLAGCLQVWPWLRRQHPAVHRLSGRVYVFGGVLPAGVAVLGVAPCSSFVSQVGNTLLALLWVPVTIAGYRAARQRRFVEHREWMIRSFALTTSIVVNRLWLVALLILLAPGTGSAFGGDEAAMVDAAAAASVWLSWVVNLLVAEWWLHRGRSARLRAKARPAVPPDTQNEIDTLSTPSAQESASRKACSISSTGNTCDRSGRTSISPRRMNSSATRNDTSPGSVWAP
jgi:hypothetical protein